jgi:hypothetical protein
MKDYRWSVICNVKTAIENVPTVYWSVQKKIKLIYILYKVMGVLLNDEDVEFVVSLTSIEYHTTNHVQDISSDDL